MSDTSRAHLLNTIRVEGRWADRRYEKGFKGEGTKREECMAFSVQSEKRWQCAH